MLDRTKPVHGDRSLMAPTERIGHKGYVCRFGRKVRLSCCWRGKRVTNCRPLRSAAMANIVSRPEMRSAGPGKGGG